MSDIPKPRSSDERVFVSCYRFNSIVGFLAKVFLPGVGVVCLVAFPVWCWKFYQVMGDDLPPEAESRFRILLLAVLLLGTLTSLAFFLLSVSFKRRFFGCVVSCDDQGIVYRMWSNEVVFEWSEIESITPRAMGRLQTAVVKTSRGRFYFDATLFDAHGPRPDLQGIVFGRGKMVFPNGDVTPLLIRENELFRAIEKRLAREPQE